MIKNFLKVAFRNLVRNKMHSFINIFGLSVGMAVAMLIGFWIHDELSFDKDNPEYEHIAQVEQHLNHNGKVQTWQQVPWPLAEELRSHYGSDFKSVVLATGSDRSILAWEQKTINSTGSYFEPAGPQLLGLHMLRGDRNSLQDPSSILLAASTAKALFGEEDPMGKVLKLDNKSSVKVSGVYADLPSNSSFADLRFMAPWQLFYTVHDMAKMTEPWRPNAWNVYVRLNDHTDIQAVSARIRDAKLRNVNARLAGHKPRLFLHPMSKWHLYDEFRDGVNTGGRIQYVWMFGLIGVFVLLLACINFMNLSTARSEKRAKEVGIRKAIGSMRAQLIGQFFSESLLVVFLAFVLSIGWVCLGMPLFNAIAEKQISFPWGSVSFWLYSLGFCLITGIISGCYPALYLSSFQPVKVLKGTFKVGRLAVLPRKVLVVLQFSVSILLIIGTLVVMRQINFAKDRPVGYSRDGLVVMPMLTEDIHKHFSVIRDELRQSGAIADMAEAVSPTTGIGGSTSGIEWPGKDPSLAVDMPFGNASLDYGRTVGWKFREGRDFSKDFLTDSSAMVLNEAAVKFMGLQHPLGETLKWDGQPFHVIGVIEDMVINSPYEEVRPMVYVMTNWAESYTIARIHPSAAPGQAMDKIGTVFRKYNPAQPFTYEFVDEAYAKKFGNEVRLARLAGIFALLAIFISCLGLFGMASFMAEQRVKEIGVRKVLGASVLNLWQLLSRDFVVLVCIAFLIAAPLAWYSMSDWLEHYQYRTGIAWWIFVAAGSGAMLIALLTVSYQTIRAALANPVKSLRSE